MTLPDLQNVKTLLHSFALKSFISLIILLDIRNALAIERYVGGVAGILDNDELSEIKILSYG